MSVCFLHSSAANSTIETRKWSFLLLLQWNYSHQTWLVLCVCVWVGVRCIQWLIVILYHCNPQRKFCLVLVLCCSPFFQILSNPPSSSHQPFTNLANLCNAIFFRNVISFPLESSSSAPVCFCVILWMWIGTRTRRVCWKLFIQTRFFSFLKKKIQ